jgi:hypothetical protein
MGRPMDRNWRLIYANWQASGLSKSAYCRDHNISINRFRYHALKLECQRVLSEHQNKQVMEPPQFAEVVCSESTYSTGSPPPSTLTLRLTCGSTIELSAGFNSEILKQVLEIARQL